MQVSKRIIARRPATRCASRLHWSRPVAAYRRSPELALSPGNPSGMPRNPASHAQANDWIPVGSEREPMTTLPAPPSLKIVYRHPNDSQWFISFVPAQMGLTRLRHHWTCRGGPGIFQSTSAGGRSSGLPKPGRLTPAKSAWSPWQYRWQAIRMVGSCPRQCIGGPAIRDGGGLLFRS